MRPQAVVVWFLLAVAACSDRAGVTADPAPGIADDAPSFPLAPPWRADALPSGTHVSTAGHSGDGYFPCPGTRGGGCGYDLGAVRWDPAAREYSGYATGSSTARSNRAIWGMPLHSPVDGHIVSCWRSMPDDLPDQTPDTPPACAALPGGECMALGNHVWIRTLDRHLVFLAHLMDSSIPEHLCPIPADEPIPDNDSRAPCAIPGKLGGVVTRARLDRLDPPVPFPAVSRGDYLGRVGESGQTGGPHLHLSVGTFEMDDNDDYCRSNVLIRWTDASYQVRTPGVAPTTSAWLPLDEEPLPVDLETFFLLQPDV